MRPTIPDEQPPFATESRLRDYLARMFRACKTTLDHLFRWTVDHVLVTAPEYKEDPHPQYWHEIKDSAFAHMFYQEFFPDFGLEKTVQNGGVITGWEGDIISPYHMVTDLVAGTITVDTGEDYGAFHFDIGCDIKGTANNTYFIQVFRNGVGTNIAIPIALRGSSTTGRASMSGIGVFYPGDIVDVRLISDGPSADIMQINLSLHRYLNLGEYDTGVEDGYSTPVLTPGYGQAGP